MSDPGAVRGFVGRIGTCDVQNLVALGVRLDAIEDVRSGGVRAGLGLFRSDLERFPERVDQTLHLALAEGRARQPIAEQKRST